MQGVIDGTARRILIIDDNEAIHADFSKTLLGGATTAGSARLTSAKAALFGEDAAPAAGHDDAGNRTPFELDFAIQGQQGFAKVELAIRTGTPYAVAFVDMRMPPGWDGLQTIQRLWDVDPNLQVVICT